MNPGECCAVTIGGSCVIFVVGGVVAGVAALEGLVGAAIFNDAYPDWTDISTTDFVKAMIVGNLIPFAGVLGVAACCVVPVAMAAAVSNDGPQVSIQVTKKSIDRALLSSGISGALTGMLGSWSLGQLKSSSDTGFAAASGAVGAAIISFGTYVLCSPFASRESLDAESEVEAEPIEVSNEELSDVKVDENVDSKSHETWNGWNTPHLLYQVGSNFSNSLRKKVGFSAEPAEPVNKQGLSV